MASLPFRTIALGVFLALYAAICDAIPVSFMNFSEKPWYIRWDVPEIYLNVTPDPSLYLCCLTVGYK